MASTTFTRSVELDGTAVDTGELGTVPMDELRGDVGHGKPIELFFDLTGAVGAAVPVQDAWGAWFAHHRAMLTGVNILVSGKYMQFTIDVVKLFSRTGELIRLYLDPAAFASAFARATIAR